MFPHTMQLVLFEHEIQLVILLHEKLKAEHD